VTDPDATEYPVDPNRTRRAVISVAGELMHDLLQLPPDVEVRHFGISPDSLTINVVVTSPDLPELERGATAHPLTPAYAKIYDRPVLADTGIGSVPGAVRWEWNYRYPDTGPTQLEPLGEWDARTTAARDLSVILLRRRPGTTDWEEAPA